jgi:hypothetical protein
MTLQFDSSPYLQVWAQRKQEESQRPQSGILESLKLIADQNRQQQLMELQKQQLANTHNQQQFERAQTERESAYKYGTPISPDVSVGAPGGMGQSRLFGNQPMQVGQGSSLIEQFNKFRAGGMKPSEARPEFMGALGQEERKQFQNIANPKPVPKYAIPTYDNDGNVIGYSELPEGTKPFGGGKPTVQPKGALKTPDAQAAFNLYETARDGLLSGLEGSTTGPIAGRFPAFTSEQQIAEGSVAAMAPVLKQLFRVAGEGVFTDRDQALLLAMIPTRTTRPEARAAQIQNIDNIVKAKLKMNPEASDSADGQEQGVPQVGGTFEGGRVKSVRRVR